MFLCLSFPRLAYASISLGCRVASFVQCHVLCGTIIERRHVLGGSSLHFRQKLTVFVFATLERKIAKFTTSNTNCIMDNLPIFLIQIDFFNKLKLISFTSTSGNLCCKVYMIKVDQQFIFFVSQVFNYILNENNIVYLTR